jgi:hypothetical protein
MNANGKEYLNTFPESKVKTPSMDQVILQKTARKHTTSEFRQINGIVCITTLHLNHMPYTAPSIS